MAKPVASAEVAHRARPPPAPGRSPALGVGTLRLAEPFPCTVPARCCRGPGIHLKINQYEFTLYRDSYCWSLLFLHNVGGPDISLKAEKVVKGRYCNERL